MALVDLVDVTKRYGDVEVLHGVSCRIERDEQLAIVGPSGSGKSTLLQIMGTLDRPTAGIVRIDGRDTAGASDAELSALRAHTIGFVFQQFHLMEGRTALDNVADGLIYAGLPAEERRARAADALKAVGLAHRTGHRPSELSGGERQRTAIARAIAGGPSILFADEPTGALDSRTGAAVVELLRELGGRGTTIVVITHDVELARSFPRRIAVRDGAIVEDVRQVAA